MLNTQRSLANGSFRFAMLLGLSVGMSHSTQAESPLVDDHNHATTREAAVWSASFRMAKAREAAFESLLKEGFASPAEFERSRTQRFLVEVLEDMAASAPSPVAEDASHSVDHSFAQPFLTVCIPQFRKHPSLKRFAFVSLPIALDHVSTNSDITMSNHHRRSAIEMKIRFQRQLAQRLSSIAAGDSAATTELEQAKLRLAELKSQKNVIDDLVVLRTSVPHASEQFVSLSSEPDLQESFHDREAATDILRDQADSTRRKVDKANQELELRRRRANALANLCYTSETFREESNREQLLLNMAEAQVTLFNDELAVLTKQQGYLEQLIPEPSQGPFFEWQTNLAQLIEIFELTATSVGQASLAEADVAYWNWKTTALNDLYAEGYASWRETRSAEVQLEVAKLRLESAREYMLTASKTADALRRFESPSSANGVAISD